MIRLDEESEIEIGKLGRVALKRGFYVYVGSALSGLGSRLRRHLRKEKKKHWHIDYLLEKSKIMGVVVWESPVRLEDRIASKLIKKFEFVKGFGSSDSKLKSHLFFCTDKYKLIDALFKSLCRRAVFVEF